MRELVHLGMRAVTNKSICSHQVGQKWQFYTVDLQRSLYCTRSDLLQATDVNNNSKPSLVGQGDNQVAVKSVGEIF